MAIKSFKNEKALRNIKKVLKRIKETPSPFSEDFAPKNDIPVPPVKKVVPVVDERTKLETLRSKRQAENEKQIKEITLIFSTIALGAKLATIDGDINKDEIDSFKKIFPKTDKPEIEVGKFFGNACNDDTSYAHHAKRVTSYFPKESDIYKDLLSSLFDFGAVDGPLNPQEINFLEEVSNIFGLEKKYFYENLRRSIVPISRDPFEILGVSKKSSGTEIKTAYRKAIQAYHPDRLSVLKSAEQILEMANERFDIVQKAYGQIKILKNLK